MEKKTSLSRRNFMKLGMTTVATGVGATALGREICGPTVSQTSGPFPPSRALFRVGGQSNPGEKFQVTDHNNDLTTINGTDTEAIGQKIIVHGKIVDESCTGIANALVHMWQADDNGHYNHINDSSTSSAQELDQGFQYSGETRTDQEGNFSFKTILPKYYEIGRDELGNSVLRTAHLHFLIRKLGFEQLITQTYFEGDALDEIETIRDLNTTDIILAPDGKILPEMEELIVEFNRASKNEVPSGEVQITLRKL